METLRSSIRVDAGFLGGDSGVGLVITGDWDVALAAAGFVPAAADFGPPQGEQTIS